MHNKLSNIISTNMESVGLFLENNINDAKMSNTRSSKVSINCPYCDENRRRHKMVINLDYGGYYRCFRCGATGTLFQLCKHFGIKPLLIEFLSDLVDISTFDLASLIKNDTVDNTLISDNGDNDEIKTVSDNNKKVIKFVNSNLLFPISELSLAQNYALSRTFNNKIEIANYLADDKYIYVPIITNDTVTSYMGRLYINSDEYQKYMLHQLSSTIPSIGFYDDVISNMSSNEVYITEGYFDSYAINYAMSNYVSVCAFGKSKVASVAAKLITDLPTDTKIYLTLDSVEKDRKIVEANVKYGKQILKYFPNLYIIELPDSDPAEILNTKGPLELKNELNTHVTPFIKYSIKHALNKR